MRILLVGAFSHFWHEEAWSRALKELGHDVIEFRYGRYLRRNLAGRLAARFLLGPLVKRINQDLIRATREIACDVVLLYRSLLIRPDTVAALRERLKAVFVSYNNDNLYGPIGRKAFWRYFRRTLRYCDLHLVSREEDLVRYQRDYPGSVYQLYSHYLPWLHRRLGKSSLGSYESDVCFLGHCEPDRRLAELDRLMRCVRANYVVRGSNWGRFSRGRPWHGLVTKEVQGEEYVRYLNGTKIALSFLSSWNHDTYTRRVFEIPACGAFLLCQRTATMMRLYDEDRQAVFYENSDELIDKVRFYLKHELARRGIAEAGWRRCVTAGYDIYSRMREWLREVNRLRG